MARPGLGRWTCRSIGHEHHGGLVVEVESPDEAAEALRAGAGVAIASLGTAEAVLGELAGLFGGFLSSRTFPSVRAIAAGANGLAPHRGHTDGNYEGMPPDVFALQVVRADVGGGGASNFWCIAELLAALPQPLRNAMERTAVRFERPRPNGGVSRYEGPMIGRAADGGLRLRFGQMRRVTGVCDGSDGADIIDEACATVDGWLDRTDPISYLGKPGDVLVVANRLVLHGRAALSERSRRLVRRAWFAGMG